MKLKYFCLECKESITSGEALVVDDSCPGTFCSELCIENFYDNQIKDFLEQEQKFRDQYQIAEYANPDILEDYIDDIFESPDEVLEHSNSLGHSYFLYQKEILYLGSKWTAIIVALHADDTPSIILFKTLTQDPRIISFFMMGTNESPSAQATALETSQTEIASDEQVKLPKDVMDWVEQKKSSVLAEHLNERDEDDIAIEEFTDYESYLMSTLDEPDEVYVNKDSEGDELYTYIKAFESDDTTFYYYALCMLPEWDDKPDNLEEMQVFIPVLTFPSTDGNIYRKYSSGKKYSGKLKN